MVQDDKALRKGTAIGCQKGSGVRLVETNATLRENVVISAAVGGGFGTGGTGAGELTCAIVGDATTAPVIDASDLFFFRVHSLGCGPPHRKIRAAATISARGPTDGREHLAEAITGRTQARVSFVVIGSSLPTTQASCPAPMTARTLPGTRSRVAAVVYGAQELAEMTY